MEESGAYTGGGNYRRLNRDVVQRLGRITPWRSFVALLVDWVVIFAAIILTEYYFNWGLYLLAVVVIGTRQHALGILMHEATHFRISGNRKLNDWAGEIFMAWPLLVTLCGYRKNHLAHHRETNGMHDPDWVRKLGDPYFNFPVERDVLLIRLMKAALGFRFVFEVRAVLNSAEMKDIPSRIKKMRVLFYLAVLGSVLATDNVGRLIMYWFVPLATSFSLLMYIRSTAEHYGGTMKYDDVLGASRNVITNWCEGLFFPHRICYHLDHHLYPAVPFYRLPELHDRLMDHEDYRERAHNTNGYAKGLWDECLAHA